MCRGKLNRPAIITIIIVLLLVFIQGAVLAATTQEIRDNAIKTGTVEAQSAKNLGATNYQTPPPIVLGYIGYGASKDSIAKSSAEYRDFAVKNGGTEVQAAKR